MRSPRREGIVNPQRVIGRVEDADENLIHVLRGKRRRRWRRRKREVARAWIEVRNHNDAAAHMRRRHRHAVDRLTRLTGTSRRRKKQEARSKKNSSSPLPCGEGVPRSGMGEGSFSFHSFSRSLVTS